ncbi:YbaB/EbfC family nucleoid-associated protein [bacterium]|nr:YbaB/EbfC family nucleoid-associated protein [bacterium]
MKGFNNMIQQAQALQQKMMEVQREVEKKTVESTAGGGMVKAVVNGRNQVVDLKIEKEIVNPDDIEMLRDLIIAAINKGLEDAQAMVAEAVNRVTGNMNLPNIFK